jgi:hypothetical protein
VRVVYADPPYIGQAKRHYGDHPDFGGEVDHRALIDRLDSEWDCWALSLSMKSLREILPMCPEDVMVLSWVKPIAPPMGDKRIYSWEPVITRGGRRPEAPTRTHLVASPPQFTFRGTPEGHVIGEKPEAFCLWLFAALGLQADDEFTDLFPGSGAVARTWEAWRTDPSPAPAESGLDRWLAGSAAKWSRPSLAEVQAAGYEVAPRSD